MQNSINVAQIPITLKPKNLHESNPIYDNQPQIKTLKESTIINLGNKKVNMAHHDLHVNASINNDVFNTTPLPKNRPISQPVQSSTTSIKLSDSLINQSIQHQMQNACNVHSARADYFGYKL
jgi:hypothetical protein